MKRYRACASLLTALMILFAAEAWAEGQPAASENMPSILAALDAGKVTVLDDQAAQAIRGQNYQYVLVRTVLNLFDIGPGLSWTMNIYGYRYGAWGGPGWTTGGGVGDDTPADPMDQAFMDHDTSGNDAALIAALQSLPNSPSAFWGQIYIPTAAEIHPGSDVPVDKQVWVSSFSLLAGKFFLGWHPMRATEYFRREALAGIVLSDIFP